MKSTLSLTHLLDHLFTFLPRQSISSNNSQHPPCLTTAGPAKELAIPTPHPHTSTSQCEHLVESWSPSACTKSAPSPSAWTAKCLCPESSHASCPKSTDPRSANELSPGLMVELLVIRALNNVLSEHFCWKNKRPSRRFLRNVLERNKASINYAKEL